jgi:methylated-DNA-[protein]-cysteine S-methyltransferase
VTASVIRPPLRNGREADKWIETRTPSGDPIYVAFSNRGISFVSPAIDSADFVMRHFERTGRMATPASADDHMDIVKSVRGGRTDATTCDLEELTPFTRRVLETTLEIPHGETRSYEWLARNIGMPQAARAVSNALASNPVPLVVPCHRVVGGDGSIGEYALGQAVKRQLLAAEGQPIPAAA